MPFQGFHTTSTILRNNSRYTFLKVVDWGSCTAAAISRVNRGMQMGEGKIGLWPKLGAVLFSQGGTTDFMDRPSVY